MKPAAFPVVFSAAFPVMGMTMLLLTGLPPAQAQFQMPQPSSEAGKDRSLPQFLKYQYAFGSESDLTYRRDPDLNRLVRDNSVILAPQLNGHLIYRVADWLETTLELILEKEIATQEEAVVMLPSGEIRTAPSHPLALQVDQAFIRIKGVIDPFELTIGRRNFEDERRWLYDTALDSVALKYKKGNWVGEASVSRKDWLDLNLTGSVTKGRINNYMLVLEYRGIENAKLIGYAIARHDSLAEEGRPRFLGLRAYGQPNAQLSFWSELALLRGSDELAQPFRAHAFDLGATYRFTRHAMVPSLTLGYAAASGDGNPGDGVNRAFRQTGLQSNEPRLASLAKFKLYGQALDPELSNLRIFTLGAGFRPTPTMSFDVLYHRYRLSEVSDNLRNTALTAEINQIDGRMSRDIGSGIDLVLAWRNLFGLRRFGVDLRAGWFYPGAAFARNDGSDHSPVYRNADKGIGILTKFWW